jgi:hypothetical protein
MFDKEFSFLSHLYLIFEINFEPSDLLNLCRQCMHQVHSRVTVLHHHLIANNGYSMKEKSVFIKLMCYITHGNELFRALNIQITNNEYDRSERGTFVI